ncbi:HAMP domain-containing protein [Scytonema sp. UIC 10036]|uniref:sensor histidine kinase n=1 Tax=Scytonema sp. UIC 10036 TaxID=2304196 RepID=UPI0012DAA4E7|nr:HAMP domain-containing sensor histidine kinase [Scytonema sp. UIC 10036]MUG96383.1 HAMP domain-containing protein [Scytonema sp. UIC 10036]
MIVWRNTIPKVINESVRSATKLNMRKGLRQFFGEARTRILLWYVLIITFILVVSIPAFRILLYARVDTRVRGELKEVMHLFKTKVLNKTIDEEIEADNETIEDSQIDNLDREYLKSPSSKRELKDFFSAFLFRQLTEDDTYLIAFVDGKFYKSSPRGRPQPLLAKNSKLMEHWAKLTEPEQGEQEVRDPAVDSIIYVAEPVTINGKTVGVFVVAHITAGERREVLEAVTVIIQVSIVVMIIAFVLAWIASGRVLAPLRLLIATTRSIGEYDLQKRISVRGGGEIAELATTFNEMMDRLQAAFMTQRDFINDAGHELRTPITIIQGHLELMEEDPQDIHETRTLVLDELDRMSRFVEDLILLARAERPDFLQLARVDVKSLTEELFAKAKALGNRTWILDASADGQTIADRQRITQAVMNLAQNAVQFTKEADIITIGSSMTKNKVHFWVRDTGEGIAVSDQQRIFQRFARAANSRRRSEGAGLGLSIVKAIAEAHGGEVQLQSQPGKGASFTIVLPIKQNYELSNNQRLI